MTTPLEQRLRAELQQVAHTTNVPDIPSPASPLQTRGRSRTAIALAAVGVVMAIGVPVAAAGGLDAAGRAFGWSQDTPLPAAGTPIVLLRMTDNGRALTLFRDHVRGGQGTCYSVIDAAAPVNSPPVIAECSSEEPSTSLTELGNNTSPAGSDGLVSAPGATLIRLVSGNASRTVPVVQGIGYVHVTPKELNDVVTLTSLRPDGSEIQSCALHLGKDPGPNGIGNAVTSATASPAVNELPAGC